VVLISRMLVNEKRNYVMNILFYYFFQEKFHSSLVIAGNN